MSLTVCLRSLRAVKLMSLCREPFVATFWQLSLPELAVPYNAYEATSTRLETSIKRLEGWISLRSTTSDWAEAYRTNKAELANLLSKFKDEKVKQEQLVADVATRMASARASLMPSMCLRHSHSLRTLADPSLAIDQRSLPLKISDA